MPRDEQVENFVAKGKQKHVMVLSPKSTTYLAAQFLTKSLRSGKDKSTVTKNLTPTVLWLDKHVIKTI